MRKWRKSSYSGATNECVEVADAPGAVLVRDTRYRELGHIAFPGEEWAAFVRLVKADPKHV